VRCCVMSGGIPIANKSKPKKTKNVVRAGSIATSSYPRKWKRWVFYHWIQLIRFVIIAKYAWGVCKNIKIKHAFMRIEL